MTCQHLDQHGRRCHRPARTMRDIHGDGELYDYPAWWRVALCGTHDREPSKRAKKVKP